MVGYTFQMVEYAHVHARFSAMNNVSVFECSLYIK